MRVYYLIMGDLKTEIVLLSFKIRKKMYFQSKKVTAYFILLDFITLLVYQVDIFTYISFANYSTGM